MFFPQGNNRRHHKRTFFKAKMAQQLVREAAKKGGVGIGPGVKKKITFFLTFFPTFQRSNGH